MVRAERDKGFFIGAFHEMRTVAYGPNHQKVIGYMLQNEGAMLVSKIHKVIGASPATGSRTKDDLVTLKLCKEIETSDMKLMIKIKHKPTLIKFFNRYKFLEGTALVRVHKIEIRALRRNREYDFIEILKKSKYSSLLNISKMENNRKYSIMTELGTIVIYQNGTLLQFFIPDFMAPVRKEDLKFFKSYIEFAIIERIKSLLDICDEIFKSNDKKLKFTDDFFEVTHIKTLSDIHMGIVTGKELNNAFNISNQLRQSGLNPDKSVPHCLEWEAQGYLDEVLEKIVKGLNVLLYGWYPGCIGNDLEFGDGIEHLKKHLKKEQWNRGIAYTEEELEKERKKAFGIK